MTRDAGNVAGDSPRQGLRGDYSDRWSHHEIGYLILATETFIVYIDKEGDLDWETSVEYDKEIEGRSEFDKKERNAIRIEAAALEATPFEGLSPQVRQQFKRLIGEALACSLNLDYEGARNVIGAARQYFRSRSQEISRYWYLSASALAALPFAFAGLLLWSFRGSLTTFEGSTAFWLELSACAGAVGALLSVITRTGTLKFDSSAGLKLHYIEGGSRIVAGAISGFLVGLAVKSEMLFAPLVQGHSPHLIMLLAALVGGTGERLAHSIISKIEERPETKGAERPGGSADSRERLGAEK